LLKTLRIYPITIQTDKIMIQEEILDNNKLIRDFMGVNYSKGVLGDSRIYFKIKVAYMDDEIISAEEDFRYHISWDWLMPVVDKIENDCSHEVVVFGDHCHINQGDTHDMGYSSKGSKKESTYQAVIEFIKWYNVNKENI